MIYLKINTVNLFGFVIVNARHKSLLRNAKVIGCDTIIAFRPENIFYMTGFWGEAAVVLQKAHDPIIVAPELEALRASSDSGGYRVVTAERGMRGLATSAARVAKKEDRGSKHKAMVCTDCQDYQTMQYLKKAVPKITQTQEPFYTSRIVKDDSEIKILKKASKIIDNLFDACCNKMQAGQRETDLQAFLMAEAAGQGAFDVGYASTLNPLIVAGGPNGALPHAQVSQRRLKRGDLVVVDLTLRCDGYVSDATRTFAVGSSPSAEAQRVYDIVRESQRLGVKRARAGTACSIVDDACRSYIAQQGYEKYFIHSTGHGIGLEVHEMPAVSKGISTPLKTGMAITVEPGIYIPEKFGVRIEDSLVIRKPGSSAMVMHRFTKELVTV